MEQFVAVAVAHFLALLIPGVDFLLVSRTAVVDGWRRASGVCLGIAAANGLVIAAAFCGLSLISRPDVLLAVQLTGGVFLVATGVAFVRSAAHLVVSRTASAARVSWAGNVGLGLASGLLNPKNALFYLSLASTVAGASPVVHVGYGAWMVGVVLAWDLLVAAVVGHPQVLARGARVLPWVTKVAGVFLVLFGAVMAMTVLLRLAGRPWLTP